MRFSSLRGVGDTIAMVVSVDPKTTIRDRFVITYFDQTTSTIITCGHCLPKNAHLKCGTVLYTSGYDNEDDDVEVAGVHVWNSFLFTEYLDEKPVRPLTQCLDGGTPVFLKCDTDYVLGVFVGTVRTSASEHVTVTIRGRPYVLSMSDVPRIRPPFFVVAPRVGRTLSTRHGYSGSPWMTYSRNTRSWYVLGAHVARVVARCSPDRECQLSLVLPITCALKRLHLTP